MYEAAKKAGDIDAGNVTEWLKSDYESIGDWEYRVIRVDSKESSVLEVLSQHGRPGPLGSVLGPGRVR